jgi:glyoxylase-like metal-dependent hydrolase (beta-lactamase superfamily II)
MRTVIRDSFLSQPEVYTFFDQDTSTWTYLVIDPATKTTAIVDPVLDYDPASATISTASADGLFAFIEQEGLKISWIL